MSRPPFRRRLDVERNGQQGSGPDVLIDDDPDQVEVRLRVNGRMYGRHCESRKLLVDFLREDLGLTGTHAGCEHGVCGACTILFNGEAARSCITFAVQADGAEIVTIEGLASAEGLHPMQQAFQKHHALQCGFCTPGMLIAAIDFLQTVKRPTEEQIRDAMSAVVCRCTGYRGIVRAVSEVAAALAAADTPARSGESDTSAASDSPDASSAAPPHSTN